MRWRAAASKYTKLRITWGRRSGPNRGRYHFKSVCRLALATIWRKCPRNTSWPSVGSSEELHRREVGWSCQRTRQITGVDQTPEHRIGVFAHAHGHAIDCQVQSSRGGFTNDDAAPSSEYLNSQPQGIHDRFAPEPVEIHGDAMAKLQGERSVPAEVEAMLGQTGLNLTEHLVAMGIEYVG